MIGLGKVSVVCLGFARQLRVFMDNVKVDDIAEALRKRILSGEFGTGGRLPSQRMFAEEYETSRETINKVIQRLQAEGLLTSLGLQGVFVRAPRVRIPGHFSRFASYLKGAGLDAVESVIGSPTIVDASSDVAQFLGVSEGTPVVYSLRRQGTTTAHYRTIETFYPMALVGGSILEHLQANRNFDVLSAIKQTHGKSVKHVREDILGRFPTQHEQDVLSITRATPILEVNSVFYAQDDTIVMYNRSILVASYFVLSYDYAANLLT